MRINKKDLRLSVSIENEMLCSGAFFSLLKKFISKLEQLCAEEGVCSIANIELKEPDAGDPKSLKMVRFDVKMNNGHTIRVATSARTLDDAVSNAFDECVAEMFSLRENRA